MAPTPARKVECDEHSAHDRPPFADNARLNAYFLGDRTCAAAFGRQQHYLRPLQGALRRARGSAARLKHFAYLRPEPNLSCFGNHPDLESWLTRKEKWVLDFASLHRSPNVVGLTDRKCDNRQGDTSDETRERQENGRRHLPCDPAAIVSRREDTQMYANYPFPGMVLIQQSDRWSVRPEIQVDGSGCSSWAAASAAFASRSLD